jgi:hypothetical protein
VLIAAAFALVRLQPMMPGQIPRDDDIASVSERFEGASVIVDDDVGIEPEAPFVRRALRDSGDRGASRIL